MIGVIFTGFATLGDPAGVVDATDLAFVFRESKLFHVSMD